MGKTLLPRHLDFFTARMDEHSAVARLEPIPSEDEYLFRIVRVSDSRNDVIVHLTDAYHYGLADLFARPRQLRSGSFVVLGLPHGSFDDDVVAAARARRIGVGHIGKLMGALNYERVWEYMTPEERDKQNREGGKAPTP